MNWRSTHFVTLDDVLACLQAASGAADATTTIEEVE